MIQLPQKPVVISEDGNHGVYEIKELFPGYGYTIGNSIRRVLLSSLPGAVITAVKIEGVGHEFSTIEGVVEDVVEIILNLKQIRFKAYGDETSYKAFLAVKGEKEVRAKDIKTSSQLEVVNPEAYITTLSDKKASLTMEFDVEVGVGYVPAEERIKERVEIGTIALDASFSPVRHVNYEVENMRVGDRTDYNLVRFTVETDGSITPKEAITKSIAILVEQFRALSEGFSEKEEASDSADEKQKDAEEENEEAYEEASAKLKVETLKLSNRTLNALNKSGVKNVGSLVKKTEKKLRETGGLGDKGVQEIKKALGNLGLTLKQ